MSAAAAIAARKRRYVAAFYQHGALSPGTARTLADVGQRPSRWFQQMAQQAIFVEVSEGKYYLDQQVWAETIERQRRLALVVVPVMVIAALIAGLFL